jgi:hypothetical protein
MTEQHTGSTSERELQYLKDKRERRAKEFGGRLVVAEELKNGDSVISAYGPADQARVIDSIKVSRSPIAPHRDGFTLHMEDGFKPVGYSRNSHVILIGR